MSPASRSKSKDKKASNDPQKVSSRPPMATTAAAATGNGVPASAYNPHWGTFHTLEAGPTLSVSPLQLNGRFRSMDETDEHPNGGSHGNGVEYDSISNNSSWSGESEEHKEKSSNTPVRPQTTATPVVDNDKREKIRQKNEKKHQRQKEKRAQELHDRCCGYLMSRKLEALAQQLVAMGFSHERATMALMMNEGRVEESVAWLFEAGDDDSNRDPNLCGANLKIDISEELAQLTDMESKFKLSKQEVERAVVSCEGDLENAAETLRKMKQDLPPVPSKPGETGDPPIVAAAQNSMKALPKPNPSSTLQQRIDEKKVSAMVGESLEHGSKNVQVMKRAQPKLEWAKSQPTTVPSEKRWTTAPSSYSLASSLQASHPPTKIDNRYVSVGNEFKNPLQGSVAEPIIMMQRPQSSNAKQIPVSSSVAFAPGTVTSSWNPPTNGFDTVRSSGVSSQVTGPGSGFSGSNQFYPVQYQQQYGIGTSPGEANWGIQQQQQQYGHGSGMGDFYGTGRGWSSRGGAGGGVTPTLAAASSLGLFSGLGSTSGPSSPIDWNNGSSSMDIDYTNIDWSLDRGGGPLSNPNKSSNLMLGLASVMNTGGLYDLDAPELGLGTHQNAMRGVQLNGKGGRSFQDGVVGSDGSGSGASREWTSPFEGNDIFSLPRQFVSSPFSVD